MSKLIQRRQAKANFDAGADSVHPLLSRIYQHRGVMDSSELDRSLSRLLPYSDLAGIEQAVNLLQQALAEKWRVLIVGDFDADGATSSALAVRALRMMGCEQVDFLVPNRFEFGYGLTPEITVVALENKPDLIVTVDNGIASIDGVQAAKEQGVRVLITDHHLPAEHVPDADAIVNPNQHDDNFASKHLAGVGVIFYVMLALRSHLREAGWFAQQGIAVPNLAELLDLVALGTVADVVKLDQNNRILVAQGLARIRAGKCCPGISALIQISGRNQRELVASDLGFALGPRLNAAGRLDDMSLGIGCLLTDDDTVASDIAHQLDDLNLERRRIEGEMKAEAMVELGRLELGLSNAKTDSNPDASAELPYGLCLYKSEWHQGVIGILASRIKDRLHRPVIVFARSSDSELKGSARSIPGFHLRDALDSIASRYPDLLQKFGGHSMAAGLSLEADRLDEFKVAFDDEVRRHLQSDDLRAVVMTDGELPVDACSLEMAELLRNAQPWGQGFPEPLFDDCFEVLDRRLLKDAHLKLRLRRNDSDQILSAIAFNQPDLFDDATDQVRLAYKLDVNEYKGVRTVQLLVEHLESA